MVDPITTVYGSDGTPKVWDNLQIAKPDGTVVIPKEVWAAASDGTMYQIWPLGPGAVTLSSRNGSPEYIKEIFEWTAASSAVRYVLKTTGGVVLYDGTDLTSIEDLGPNKQVSCFVEAYDSKGRTKVSNTLSASTGPLPAPTGLRCTFKDYNNIRMDWNAVPGATSYELYRNGVSIDHGSDTAHDQSCAASTTYKFKVRSYWQSVASAFSPEVSVTSSAVPGPSPQTKRINPNSYCTWQAGAGSSKKWRPKSDGLYHGDGRAYGSTRGDQTSFFFYPVSQFHSLRSSVYRVTRCRIYVYRVYGAGIYSPQTCHWWIHKYTGVPSGSPAFGTQVTDHITNGTLDDEQGKWFDLNPSWGQRLVDGSYNGICWGGTDLPYMKAAPTHSGIPSGAIEITIG